MSEASERGYFSKDIILQAHAGEAGGHGGDGAATPAISSPGSTWLPLTQSWPETTRLGKARFRRECTVSEGWAPLSSHFCVSCALM